MAQQVNGFGFQTKNVTDTDTDTNIANTDLTQDDDRILAGGGNSLVFTGHSAIEMYTPLKIYGAGSASPILRMTENTTQGSYWGDASVGDLTANRLYVFPDSSGNVALTTDINAYTAGDGITLNTLEFDLDASQTIITSIFNAGLTIGRDSDNFVDFTTDNEIHFKAFGADRITLSKNGIYPTTSNAVPLGISTNMWSDLFLASGSIINFNNGDVTITHGTNILTIAGGNLYLPKVGRDSDNLIDFDTDNEITFRVNGVDEVKLIADILAPATNKGASLGSGTLNWGSLYLGTAGVVNFGNGGVTMTNNSSGQLTINTTSPERGVILTTRNFPVSSSTDGDTQGDVVNFGSGTVVAGKCYYLTSAGAWALADRRTLLPATSFLGVAMDDGTASSVGMCIRGMVTMDVDAGSVGDKAYLRLNGDFSNTATTSTGEFVRLMGYVMDDTNGQIFFNPSNDWVEIA